jgi:hypothetical protein
MWEGAVLIESKSEDTVCLALEVDRQSLEGVNKALSSKEFIEFRMSGTLRLSKNKDADLELSGSVELK